MMSNRTTDEQHLYGATSYLLFFITGCIFLVLERDNKFVRFHAMQSIILFGSIFFLVLILQLLPWGWLLGVFLSMSAGIIWLVLMWKALQGEMFQVPYFGDLAQKQLEKMG